MDSDGTSRQNPSSAPGVVPDIHPEYVSDMISSDAVDAEIGADLGPWHGTAQPDQNPSPVRISKIARPDPDARRNGGLEFAFGPPDMSAPPLNLKQPIVHPCMDVSTENFYNSTVPTECKAQPMPSEKSTARRPTEEDLLMLLMRRYRHRVNGHDQVIAQNERLTKKMEDFQGRYQKLKKWAMEFNIEYCDLRAYADRLKIDLDSAKAEGECVKESVKELSLSLQKTKDAVKECKQNLAEASSDTALISQKLKHSNELLERERTLRLEEKAQNERHTQYITKLETTQNEFNQNVNQQQQDIVGSLHKILSAVEDADKPDMKEIMQSFVASHKTLNMQCLVHVSKVEEIYNAVRNLGAEFAHINKSIVELKRTSEDASTSHANEFEVLQGKLDELGRTSEGASTGHANEFEVLQGKLDELKPVIEMQIKAKELEEKSKAMERRCQTFEREKMLAQLLSIGLIEVHKSQVDGTKNDKDSKALEDARVRNKALEETIHQKEKLIEELQRQLPSLKSPPLRVIDRSAPGNSTGIEATGVLQREPDPAPDSIVPNSQAEEMLLHSSEPNDNVLPHKSPLRLRSGSQIRTVTPCPSTTSVPDTTTPGGRPYIIQNRSNSAIKRRNPREDEQVSTNPKRPRRTPKGIQCQNDKYNRQFGTE